MITARAAARDWGRVKRAAKRVARPLYWWLHGRMRSVAGLASPREKVKMISAATEHGFSTLVETGTYLGETTAGCAPRFERVFTIELDHDLAERAGRRFASVPNVTVLEGDSAVELPRLCRSLDEPVVFWLDAHYCGFASAHGETETPIEQELAAIASRGRADVVLIDDAHHFGVRPTRLEALARRVLRMRPTSPDYPTLERVRCILGNRVRSFDVRRDVIRGRLGRERASKSLPPAREQTRATARRCGRDPPS